LNPVIPTGVDPAEALVAVLGVDDFLSGDVKLTRAVHDRAAGLDHTIDREMFAAFHGEPEPVPEIPLNYKEVGAQLERAKQGDREQVRIFQDAFANEDPALTAQVQGLAARVIRYLDERYPRRTRPGIVATPSMPSGVELARFKRLWAVATDPMHVVEALGRGNLSRDMVRAVEDLYPTTYAAMRRAVLKAISRTKARRASWEPSRALDLQLRALMQADTINPRLQAEIDAIPPPAASNPTARQQSNSADAGKDLQTTGQRVAAH
jgi:hypothetical protein